MEAGGDRSPFAHYLNRQVAEARRVWLCDAILQAMLLIAACQDQLPAGDDRLLLQLAEDLLRHGAGLEQEITPPAVELPAFLLNPRATRARLCVRYLAAHPESSNWQVAAGIGIVHQGQVSRLLGELERCLLVVKQSHGRGRPNAWRLTSYGEQIATDCALRENR